MSLIILGSGGHARVCFDLIRATYPDLVFWGFIDNEKQVDTNVDEIYGVVGCDDDLERFFKKGLADSAVIGFSAMEKRQEMFDKLIKIGYFLPNVVHKIAYVERSIELGYGNQIMHGAIISSNAKIFNNCIINTNSVVSHDCIIHDNVHVAPGATLAGSVEIGENTLIGMNTSVYFGKKIGKNCVISNGVSIDYNVEDNKIIKRRI